MSCFYAAKLLSSQQFAITRICFAFMLLVVSLNVVSLTGTYRCTSRAMTSNYLNNILQSHYLSVFSNEANTQKVANASWFQGESWEGQSLYHHRLLSWFQVTKGVMSGSEKGHHIICWRWWQPGKLLSNRIRSWRASLWCFCLTMSVSSPISEWRRTSLMEPMCQIWLLCTKCINGAAGWHGI